MNSSWAWIFIVLALLENSYASDFQKDYEWGNWQQNRPNSLPHQNEVKVSSKVFDAPALKCEKGLEITLTEGTLKNGFPTYEEANKFLDELVVQYPRYLRKFIAGHSYEGRDIYGYALGNATHTEYTSHTPTTVTYPNPPPYLPHILLTALHHAREPESLAVVLYFVGCLLTSVPIPEHSTDVFNTIGLTDKQLSMSNVRQLILNSSVIIVLPFVNPDGYVAIHETQDFYIRKNRRPTCRGSVKKSGVDLNRNYDYDFHKGKDPCDTEEYSGTAPFSEPETQCVKNIAEHFPFKTALNFHSYGGLWTHPYNCCNASELDGDVKRIFDELSSVLNVKEFSSAPRSKALHYATNGEADDYLLGKKDIVSMSPEVGPEGGKFWPDASTTISVCRANFFRIIDVIFKSGLEFSLHASQAAPVNPQQLSAILGNTTFATSVKTIDSKEATGFQNSTNLASSLYYSLAQNGPTENSSGTPSVLLTVLDLFNSGLSNSTTKPLFISFAVLQKPHLLGSASTIQHAPIHFSPTTVGMYVPRTVRPPSFHSSLRQLSNPLQPTLNLPYTKFESPPPLNHFDITNKYKPQTSFNLSNFPDTNTEHNSFNLQRKRTASTSTPLPDTRHSKSPVIDALMHNLSEYQNYLFDYKGNSGDLHKMVYSNSDDAKNSQNVFDYSDGVRKSDSNDNGSYSGDDGYGSGDKIQKLGGMKMDNQYKHFDTADNYSGEMDNKYKHFDTADTYSGEMDNKDNPYDTADSKYKHFDTADSYSGEMDNKDNPYDTTGDKDRGHYTSELTSDEVPSLSLLSGSDFTEFPSLQTKFPSDAQTHLLLTTFAVSAIHRRSSKLLVLLQDYKAALSVSGGSMPGTETLPMLVCVTEMQTFLSPGNKSVLNGDEYYSCHCGRLMPVDIKNPGPDTTQFWTSNALDHVTQQESLYCTSASAASRQLYPTLSKALTQQLQAIEEAIPPPRQTPATPPFTVLKATVGILVVLVVLIAVYKILSSKMAHSSENHPLRRCVEGIKFACCCLRLPLILRLFGARRQETSTELTGIRTRPIEVVEDGDEEAPGGVRITEKTQLIIEA